MQIMNDITFPTILKQERTRLGWSRKVMEQKTGIPSKTIQSWEDGTEPAGYIKRYVLAELRDKSQSASKFFDMVDLLSEIDEYLDSYDACNYVATNSILHQKIKKVLND
jgi:transcriptional regulator with XRE-family HTH domain